MERFYVGLHQPSDAKRFARCCLSVKRLLKRKSIPGVGEWMMDSGAFTEVKQHGRHRLSVEEYATEAKRWLGVGQLVAVVAQDWMCEDVILERTGLTIPEHQRLALERYDALRERLTGVYVLPVLQGYWPEEYVRHLRDYGRRLAEGQWVGVGSVCKRNTDVEEIEHVLEAIRRERPDLRLHGFGVKTTALASAVVRRCLWSADSMAWSFHARKNGRNANDWREAKTFVRRIEGQRVRDRDYQGVLF